MLIGTQREPPDVRCVAFEHAEAVPSLNIPQSRCFIVGRGQQLLPIRAKYGGIDPLTMADEDYQTATCGSIPEPRCVVP